jgi:hypothetical protein
MQIGSLQLHRLGEQIFKFHLSVTLSANISRE